MPQKTWSFASALLASVVIGCIFGYLQAPPTTRGAQIRPFVVHQVERIFNEAKDQPVFASDQTSREEAMDRGLTSTLLRRQTVVLDVYLNIFASIV